MLEDILQAIKRREETVECFGRRFIVRELNAASVLAGTKEEEEAIAKGGLSQESEIFWRIFVRSVFLDDGNPAFALADAPALDNGSRSKLAPLYLAVRRVNGLDAEDNAKN